MFSKQKQGVGNNLYLLLYLLLSRCPAVEQERSINIFSIFSSFSWELYHLTLSQKCKIKINRHLLDIYFITLSAIEEFQITEKFSVKKSGNCKKISDPRSFLGVFRTMPTKKFTVDQLSVSSFEAVTSQSSTKIIIQQRWLSSNRTITPK